MYVFTLSILTIVILLLGIYTGFFDTIVSSLIIIGVFLVPIRGLLTQQSAILNGFRCPILAQLPSQIITPFITLISLCLIILFYKVDIKAGELLSITVFSSLVGLLCSYKFIVRAIKHKARVSEAKYEIRSWHKALLPFTMLAFIGTLNTEIVSVLIGYIVGHEHVGYFKVAMQAILLVSLALTAINTVIMPNVARLYKKGDLVSTQQLLTKSVRLSTLISLPIILFLLVFGDTAIDFLFGSEYLPAYPILIVLCIGQLCGVCMGSVGLVLNMTGNEKETLKFIIITLLLNVILLTILLPHFGALGGAYSVSICLVFLNTTLAVKTRNITGLKTWFVLK
ncbi:polysaccharide biosynthesis [Vibrio ishigakensis]|uniref:Polysaccharide biosynthesis n=1 Tax=Vibrio ishigakensis TaxID=1481914 RepID=A0A0B8P794_9VIBR|nr:polysaccharide biosynthesis [Vibrio ishigakensis]